MPGIGKIATGGGFAVPDVATKGFVAGPSLSGMDWFDQFQKLNKMVGGLKWASSSWNMAKELDRERVDLPPTEKTGHAKDNKVSGWTRGCVFVSPGASAVLAFLAIINACASSAVGIIVAPDDGLQLGDREKRS